MRREALIVVAAGLGTRLGAAGGQPKALVTVRGRTLLDLTLERVRDAAIGYVVVVHTPGIEQPFLDIAQRHGVAAVVPGGETRTASVRAGLDALPDDVELIGIHDAARALLPAELIRAAYDCVRDRTVAVAPGTAVADTLKRVDADARVLETVDRSDLQAVQTPQVFRADALRAAMEHGDEATDDLALVEQAIADGVVDGEVRLIGGSPLGFKVTYPQDLQLAEALLR